MVHHSSLGLFSPHGAERSEFIEQLFERFAAAFFSLREAARAPSAVVLNSTSGNRPMDSFAPFLGQRRSGRLGLHHDARHSPTAGFFDRLNAVDAARDLRAVAVQRVAAP